LLAALKRVAKSEGRSVSAEVVHVLRRQLSPVEQKLPPRRLEGALAQFDVAEDVAEFRHGDWLKEVIDRRARAGQGRRRR
jgi:hypothetical protein